MRIWGRARKGAAPAVSSTQDTVIKQQDTPAGAAIYSRDRCYRVGGRIDTKARIARGKRNNLGLVVFPAVMRCQVLVNCVAASRTVTG